MEVANCTTLYHYRDATIRIDPEKIESEPMAREVLLHELIHVVIAPFDTAWQMAETATSGTAKALLSETFSNACEETVHSIEVMLACLAEEKSRSRKPRPKVAKKRKGPKRGASS